MMPARDLLFAAASQESTWQRLGALALAQNQVRVLCLPVEALMDRCLPAGFRQAIFPGGRGRVPAGKADGRLSTPDGWLVEGRAMRGSILDVFPQPTGGPAH